MSRRIRTLKPEILDNPRTAKLSHAAWRLFVSAIVLADDYGNVGAEPAWLGGAAFWGRAADVHEALGELAAAGLVSPYEVHGQAYMHIAGWASHQRVDHPGKPAVPGPSDPLAKPSGTFARPSGTFPLDQDQDQDQEGIGRLAAPRPSGPTEPPPAKSRSRRQRTAAPSEEDQEAFLQRWKIPTPDADPDVTRFLDHHRAKGSLMADWSATWRTWVRNGVRFGQRPPPPRSSPSGAGSGEREADGRCRPEIGCVVPPGTPDDAESICARCGHGLASVAAHREAAAMIRALRDASRVPAA
jgi:hypothetical protein